MGIKDHALMEFKAAGWMEEPVDEMQQLMMDNLLELVEVFANQGHSGFSANYAVGCLEKLLRFQPLSPLTGEDWEWNEVGGGVYQNKRCSTVFKQADRFEGKPYDIEGKIFWQWYERALEEGEEGYPGVERYKSYFTSKDSWTVIDFPYSPTKEYVEVV